MKSLFGGLDDFGMDDIEGLDLFETEEEKKALEKKKAQEIKPEDLLYDRNVRCPVCNSKIVARTIKSGAAKLVETSLNLRPVYSGVDPILYDVVSCEICGYSALNRNFNKISDRQIKEVREKISMKFVGSKYPQVYDYEIALTRYKMALYNDVTIGRNDVSKAYLCLKISWILESLIGQMEEQQQKKEDINILENERKLFVGNAYKGFMKAYDGITYPIFGMNEATYQYLLGALAYEQGDMKSTGFWLGKVLLSPNGNRRLQDKARELKAYIDKQKEKNKKTEEES